MIAIKRMSPFTYVFLEKYSFVYYGNITTLTIKTLFHNSLSVATHESQKEKQSVLLISVSEYLTFEKVL